MAKVRFEYKNVAHGIWDVDPSLLPSNGGTGFVAGQIAAQTGDKQWGLATGAAGAPAFGVFADNAAECEASGKATVYFGQGWILYIRPELDKGESLATFTENGATLTRNTKLYCSANAKYQSTANGDAVAMVVQEPTSDNGYELGIKLLI